MMISRTRNILFPRTTINLTRDYDNMMTAGNQKHWGQAGFWPEGGGGRKGVKS